MPQTEEVQCPLCSSKVSNFHINLTSDLLMCINESCTYPFETEDISKFIVQNDEQAVLESDSEIRNGETNDIELFPSISGDPSFDLNPFKSNNDLTFTSPIFSVEKNNEITDLSQFDEILNNLSANNNDFTANGIDMLLNEIDFSSTLGNDDNNNLNQADLNITLPLITNNELEVTDNLTPIISGDDHTMTVDNIIFLLF
ncbi:5957_t:CDS:2 [Cetraspora pellucida]|uniref:5957_t:CDS:1 n=1 Tax=Cetraspora pellucida TaxID=1433469 RepID=A0A9N9F2Z2_9GLOM|nr:5957_t:CDS:2 [Cetraspora pellucida]